MIATNNHVIAGAYQLQVTFSDGQTVPAKLVATAPTIDIAVIKVETQHPLVPVRWGDSTKLQIGDPVSRSATRSVSASRSVPVLSARSTGTSAIHL